ncbi:MAG: hypothetical protein DMD48_14670 [Gemmatimonadetes bacterium]|nr:MAG: hypothetical protein DMD48_14670 [Gemmatimonadota bacterium]
MDADAGRPLHSPQQAADLVELLSRKVVGQPSALQYIVPYIQMYQAGLNPADRPAGIFLLLGPTGTGKTRTAEALAEILHGTSKHLLKIDCAEYQSDHEVAKLIGAPPGYIGHRESKPLLTQERLLGVISPACDLALVLFDEIEKAAPALRALLLGILDRATMREQAGDHRARRGAQTILPGVRQPHRRRDHVPVTGRRRACRNPRSSYWRAPAARAQTPRRAVFRDRGQPGRASAAGRERRKPGIRCPRTEADDSPDAHPAARGARGEPAGAAGGTGAGRSRRRREAESATRRHRGVVAATVKPGGAGARRQLSAAREAGTHAGRDRGDGDDGDDSPAGTRDRNAPAARPRDCGSAAPRRRRPLCRVRAAPDVAAAADRPDVGSGAVARRGGDLPAAGFPCAAETVPG